MEKNGVGISVWTVNEPAGSGSCWKRGIRNITTRKPRVALRLRGEGAERRVYDFTYRTWPWTPDDTKTDVTFSFACPGRLPRSRIACFPFIRMRWEEPAACRPMIQHAIDQYYDNRPLEETGTGRRASGL